MILTKVRETIINRWAKLSKSEKLFVTVIIVLVVGVLLRFPYVKREVQRGIDIFFKNNTTEQSVKE